MSNASPSLSNSIEGRPNSILFSVLVTAIAVAATGPVVYYRFVGKRNTWQSSEQQASQLPYPPGPKPSFWLGNIPDLALAKRKGVSYLGNLYLDWTNNYGLIFSIIVPLTGRVIVVADPKWAKYILVTGNFRKSPMYQTVAPLLGRESMVLLHGEAWAQKRRAFNPGFGPAFLKGMISTIAKKLERFIECIESDRRTGNGETDLLLRSQTFTADVIVAIAFGDDWGGTTPHPARLYMSEITKLVKGMSIRIGTLLFGFRTKILVRYYERLLDQEMMKVLDRRLAAGVSAESRDICSIAINQLLSENGSSLTTADKISITHQLKTFYFAGHDTTASTISWAIWSLSQNESILAKVRAELQNYDVWSNFPNGEPPSYDQLQKCTYLEAVLKETLRLYPPAGSSRFVDDQDETFNGYRIGGAHVLVMPYVMHRHPSLWKEPNVFRPERFLDGSEANLSEKYIPFMRGPRDCLGKYFAMLEAKLAVSALVVRYDLQCVDPDDEVVNVVTLVPKNGAKVRFLNRE